MLLEAFGGFVSITLCIFIQPSFFSSKLLLSVGIYPSLSVFQNVMIEK